MNLTPSKHDIDFLRTLTVLYAEDDADVREALTHYLQRRFAKVEVAANGREGLDAFKARPADVVITDIKMPEMDGLEMAKAIKAIAADVPVIVITAYNEIDYFARAIEIGVDRYVKKPVNPEELIDAIGKGTQARFHERELERANRQLLESMQHTIAALARAIEKRDPYTDGHQKRVSQLAVEIAKELGLPEQQITGIRLGGLIHDIGKISVPLELLTTPRKLTRTEFDLIKIHAQAGADILGDIQFPWPIAQMVVQHHERLDGSGYPAGLKEGDILPEAKIIMVADVTEAMSAHRPYRAALGSDKAIQELRAGRGIVYDADAVDACLRVLERGDFTL